MSKDFEIVSDTEQAEALLAWKSGETIEHWVPETSRWETLCSYTVRVDDILRRKSQPKLRAWKMEEVPIGARIRGDNRDWIGTIIGANRGGFMISVCTIWSVPWGSSIGYEFSTDGGKTWLPVGVVE